MKQGSIESFIKRKVDFGTDETHECVEGSSKRPCADEFPQSPQGQRDEVRKAISVCRFLLKNADELGDSLCEGLYYEMFSLMQELDESICNAAKEKAPQNDELMSPEIQKHIFKCFSKEITKSICDEIHKDVFAILVDEFSDASEQEQMTIVLRYVDSLGIVKERFIGLIPMKDTSSLALKEAIDSVFTNNKLSMAQVRGQSYNEASKMRGAFNGLKALIISDNDSAHYIHSFAHQLHLVVVAVAKNHDGANDFLEELDLVVNLVCSPFKRQDIIREKYRERVLVEICNGEFGRESMLVEIDNREFVTERGLNHEISVIQIGDTRWGSHHKIITSLIDMFPEFVEFITYVEDDGSGVNDRIQAHGILSYFKTFDFVFYLHLMLEILRLTDKLSKHLQRKDQDILEAASLVKGTMKALKALRNNGFSSVLEKAFSFCQKHSIGIVEMSEYYVNLRNRRTEVTNQRHFEVDIFNTILDMQILDFGDRFGKISTLLLENMAALSPCDSFSRFDKSKLLKLSELYKNDFDDSERADLDGQLENYYHSLLHDDRFANLKEIADISRLMVETGKHLSFPLVYRLLKLALVLPVTTATVETCFSAMKLFKTDLYNKMGDDFMNDVLICNVDKVALMDVEVENVMDRLQNFKM